MATTWIEVQVSGENVLKKTSGANSVTTDLRYEAVDVGDEFYRKKTFNLCIIQKPAAVNFM